MPVQIFTKLIKKEQLRSNVFKFSVESKEIVKMAKPGQFLEIRVTTNTDPYLRRPISIYNIDKGNNIIDFIFEVKGKGTTILSQKEVGEELDVIGPLGYGSFNFKDYKNIIILGGGIGIFPLYEFAKQAKENANIRTYLGFRNKDFVLLEDEFNNVSDSLEILTDDGSYGTKGFALEKLKQDIKIQKPDCIFACGPLPMLKALRELSIQLKIPCQISLEEKMGCGIGVCLGCAVKYVLTEEETYKHVCKEGPVFEAKDVEI